MGLRIAELSVGIGVDKTNLGADLAAARSALGGLQLPEKIPGAEGLGKRLADTIAGKLREADFTLKLEKLDVTQAKSALATLESELERLKAHAGAVTSLKFNTLTKAGFSETSSAHFATQQGAPPVLGLKVSGEDKQAIAVLDRQQAALVSRTAELESHRTQIVQKFGAQRLASANAEATGITTAAQRSATVLLGIGGQAGSSGTGFTKLGMGLQQASFGLQDFLAVLSQPGMGLAAALRASSNNMSQVLSIVGPMTGAIGGLAATIGVTLVSAWLNSGDAAMTAAEKHKAAADAIEALNQRLSASFDIINKSISQRRHTAADGPRTSEAIDRQIVDKETEAADVSDLIKQKEDEAASHRRILADERQRHEKAKERGIKLVPMSEEEQKTHSDIAIKAEEEVRQLRQRRALITGEANTDDESGALVSRNKRMGRKGQFEGELSELKRERDEAQKREAPELERKNLTGDKRLDEQLKRLDEGNERYVRKRDEKRVREMDNDIDETQRQIDSGNAKFRQRREREEKERKEIDREFLPDRAKRIAEIADDIDTRREQIQRLFPEQERGSRLKDLADHGERRLREADFAGSGHQLGATQFLNNIQKGLFQNDDIKKTAEHTKRAADGIAGLREDIKRLDTGVGP